jgi:hypothetical protein
MRLTEVTFKDPELQKLARIVATVLVNLSLDNMKIVELTGKTSGTANTASDFRHAMARTPSFWFPLEGRIYVPRYGVTENDIDIRSTVANEPFRLLVVA